jgi:hypothetical protein
LVYIRVTQKDNKQKQAQGSRAHKYHTRVSGASVRLGLFKCLSGASLFEPQASKEIVTVLARWEWSETE